MEWYEKIYPDTSPHKLAFLGESVEYQRMGELLEEYMTLSKKSRTVLKLKERFLVASDNNITILLFSIQEARLIYSVIKELADIKQKVKRHRVHKILDMMDCLPIF